MVACRGWSVYFSGHVWCMFIVYIFDNYIAEVGSTITATFNVTSIAGGVTIKYMASPHPSTAAGGNAFLINGTGAFTYSHTITSKAYGIVAIFGADDAINAEKNGANRIELCGRLDLDGLTPSKDLIKSAFSILKIKSILSSI